MTLAAGATGAPNRAAGALQISATLNSFYRVDRSNCPPGTPAVANCGRVIGKGEIAGLGRATSTMTNILPGNDDNCPVIQSNTAVIEVADKGTLELSRAGKDCRGFPPVTFGPYEFTVTRGSGKYAGASGSLAYKASAYAADPACSCGVAFETWTGTLTVPGLDFDITSPTVSGAVSKTVRAPKKAKGMRVRYVVTAKDAVDGAVSVACKPRSGSFFKRGRTKVTCSATDSSGNTANVKFTVTVK
jgi:hypothetical protein